MFDHVWTAWPRSVVRRHAWKVGGSDIWYVTVVLDDAEAGKAFDAWLDRNSRRLNIAALVGGADGYVGVRLHPRLSVFRLLMLRLSAFKRRYAR